MLNVFAIVGLVLLPISLAVLIISIALHKSVSFLAISRTVSLHSSEGLAKQGLFWLSILVPIILFFEFGYFVWSGSSLELSQEGFKNFITLSALPIGLLSLSIPAAALVTKLHSTAQTAKQIIIAEKKNNYDLFYMHRREFSAYYAQIGPLEFLGEFTASYKVNPRLHAVLFSGEAADGIPMLRAKFISQRIADLKRARELLIGVLTSTDLIEALPKYLQFSKIVDDIFTHFGVFDVQKQLAKKSIKVTYMLNGEKLAQRTAGSTTRQAISAFRCAKSYMLLAMEFAGYEEGVRLVRDEEVDFIDATTGYQTIHYQQVRVIEAIINTCNMQRMKDEVPELAASLSKGCENKDGQS
ncbi:hypothetical protein QIY50_12655 [Pseudomonas putida]|nr:hypothetical protein QIY50_12655 [Pseudomonas putida]